MKKFQILLLFTVFGFLQTKSFAQKSVPTQKAHQMKIIPGKSMGEVSIGDSEAKLKKKGFLSDELRGGSAFLKKGAVLARLESGHVVQISLLETDLSQVHVHGKNFPTKSDPVSMRKFFKNCEPDVRGSGGILIYCENRGVEIAYSYPANRFEGISVVTPDLAEKNMGSAIKKN